MLGQFTSFDFPDSRLTALRKTNTSGQMIGIYQSKLLKWRHLQSGTGTPNVLVNSSYSGFDFRGSALMDGNLINDAGLIVGDSFVSDTFHPSSLSCNGRSLSLLSSLSH